MPKRFTFKFRFLSSVIPTFQLCRSKHISDHHVNPTPTSLLNPQASDAGTSATSISTPVPRRRITTPSSSTTSVGCSGRLRFSLRRCSTFSENGSTDACEDDDGKYYYRWEKDEKWHVITVNLDPPHRRKSRCSGMGIGTHSDESNDKFVSLKEKVKWRSWRSKSSRRRKSIRRSRCTSSSSGGGFQSDLTDEEEETETLVTNSSRSFLTTTTTAMTSNSTATDYSTQLNRYLNTVREIAVSNSNNSSNKRIKNTFRHRISTKKVWNRRIARRLNQKRRSKTIRSHNQRLSSSSSSHLASPGPSYSRNSFSEAEEVGSSARLSSALRRLIPNETVVEGKVRESYAVVKRSEDPYGDFKQSIMEMIVEKGIVDESDLEEMLRCLLSLNEDRHRGDILHAFVDVWAMLFFSDRVYTHHEALA